MSVCFGPRVRAALVAIVLTAVFAPASAPAFENPNRLSSSDLVEIPKEHDGEALTFRGEAVGESMRRGGHAWIHLNDDAYMYENVEEGASLGGYNSGMPVWLPDAEAERISYFGDYKHEGDVVEVTGTFNAACAQHGGDMDIHATALRVVVEGHPAEDPVKPWKVAVTLALAVAAALAYLADRRLGHRELAGLFKRR